jgi:hypothetical protein
VGEGTTKPRRWQDTETCIVSGLSGAPRRAGGLQAEAVEGGLAEFEIDLGPGEEGDAPSPLRAEHATEREAKRYLALIPNFETYLIDSGIILIKYFLTVSMEEQEKRFQQRIDDPMRQWKLSPMDLQSRIRWEDYTKAKEDMFARTNIPEAPWYIVEGNDKKRARLNCISHLLSLFDYQVVPHEEIHLPERVFNPDYERATLPPELYVPQKF